MRRHRTALAIATAALLAVGGCGGDDSPDNAETCDAYQELINDWSEGYGAEMGAVGAAVAEGDQEREDDSIEVVRELFLDTAGGMREEAEGTSDEELVAALTEAADGLVEIGEQIETYEDVSTAPEQMSSGQFASGGERVSAICAE